MRRSLLLLPVVVVALAFQLAGGPRARAEAEAPKTPHASTESVKKELTTVIDGQLAAFRANDYTKAYTFAAAEIKSMFALGDFEAMVKKGYPIISRSTASEYGIMFDTGEEAVVNVRVQTAEKQSVEYQYLLKKEADGWKIGGVAEVKAQGLGV